MTSTLRPTTAGVHPLEPLSVQEIQTAVDILRKEKGLTDSHRFTEVTLREPTKDKVASFEAGNPLEREAFATIIDRSEEKVYEAVVSLTNSTTTSWTHIPGVQPGFMLEEHAECQDIVRANPDFQAALAKRGITDMELVLIDPWSAGNYSDAPEDDQGRRLLRPLAFVRMSHDDKNAYAHPIENLVVVVYMNKGEVLRVEDHGVVPIPQSLEPFDAAAIGQFRTDLKPIEIIQPEGPSFEVDGYHVHWQNWDFRIGYTPREGLVLRQVRYEDQGRMRPVLYRAAMAEMWVPYGDTAPLHRKKNAFDGGEYNIGQLVNSLELGCDCVGDIQYFDSVMVAADGKPMAIRNAICMHEEDAGTLWKHTNTHTMEGEVRRSRRLVVSSFYTVANYDYGMFWYLYQDGTIEFEMKLTGILTTGAVEPGEKPKYGQLLNKDGLYAPIHQHFFNFRLDMDVDEGGNSVYEMNTETADYVDDNPLGNAFNYTQTLLGKESEAQRHVNTLSARHWKVVNPSVKNAVGDPVAYKLVPGENVKLMIPDHADVMKRGNFAKYHLWATQYDQEQLYAAGPYINQHAGNAGLPDYVKDDRPLEDTDVVLWYSFAVNHIVRLEDWPVMPVHHTGFKLQPHGFFDRNPALDVPSPGGNGHCSHHGK